MTLAASCKFAIVSFASFVLIASSNELNRPSFATSSFEYLSQCAGLPLATDTCLVSKTIDVFMNMEGPEDGLNGRQRFLQASKGGRARFLQALSEPTEDICGPPEITRQNLTAVMSVTKEQCEDSGIDVSDGEFNEVRPMHILSSFALVVS